MQRLSYTDSQLTSIPHPPGLHIQDCEVCVDVIAVGYVVCYSTVQMVLTGVWSDLNWTRHPPFCEV